jgi:uroporphyrinogen decarboxylase
MRQAGRALPEYRALKAKHPFAELISHPELAAEVTLQPIRRFGFDAAILFSDILVVPEALGQGFQFRDKGGVQMEFGVRTAEDVTRLDLSRLSDALQKAVQAIRLTKSQLGSATALIGFAGAPWTLANFMIEGGSAKEFVSARRLFYADRLLFDRLSEKLTAAVTEFLQMQIDAGVDAIQIFDSLGGLLAAPSFELASGRWIKQIISTLKGQVPIILFARGAHGSMQNLLETGAEVIGVDWTVSLDVIRRQLPESVAIQGNLDPLLLETTPEAVEVETKKILAQMGGRNGHIFNLGHGVTPEAKLECIERLVATVRNSHEHA